MNRRNIMKLRRRTFLKASAALPLFSWQGTARAARTAWAGTALAFVESLRRSNGGYAWPNEQRTHLTPSFAALGCYHVLGAAPPEPEHAAANLRDNHPFVLKQMARPLKVFEYQQIQALQWLGADASFAGETIEKYTKPLDYAREYEKHGYPVMGHETMACVCRNLLGMPTDAVAPAYAAYIRERRRIGLAIHGE